jgi:hypothetical protein
MTTHIKKGELEAHIKDKFEQGEIRHYFAEKQRTYISQRIAIKRALVWLKKNSPVKPCLKCKRKVNNNSQQLEAVITLPTIETIYDEGKKKYKVIDTGRTFIRYRSAVKNAINYATKKK